jgi:CRP/FNR family transcriptional regulator, cyclic AMP receptor protein
MAATAQPPPQFTCHIPQDRLPAGVSLLDADPDLTAGVPDDDVALARRALLRPRYDIPKGRWAPELLRGHDNGAFAILLIDGAILRQLDLVDRHCLQIFGPGDVLQPTADGGVLECPVTWRALVPSSVVVLDERFTRATQRWPALGLNLHRRLLDQADRIAMHAAIAQLPRVDQRILALLWQLAERWGRVTPFGVELPLDLTHEALGRLVGAQRPTVTLALRTLADEGAVTRTTDRGWLLRPSSRETLRPAAAAARR